MGFFASISKSFKLRSLSKRLGKSMLEGGDFSMERMFADSDEKDVALDDLVRLCTSDRALNHVIAQHGVSREELKELYHLLQAAGAGQWTRGHYVPASTLAFAQTLDYAVRALIKPAGSEPNREKVERVAFRLIQYFDRGEVGAIVD